MGADVKGPSANRSSSGSSSSPRKGDVVANAGTLNGDDEPPDGSCDACKFKPETQSSYSSAEGSLVGRQDALGLLVSVAGMSHSTLVGVGAVVVGAGAGGMVDGVDEGGVPLRYAIPCRARSLFGLMESTFSKQVRWSSGESTTPLNHNQPSSL